MYIFIDYTFELILFVSLRMKYFSVCVYDINNTSKLNNDKFCKSNILSFIFIFF